MSNEFWDLGTGKRVGYAKPHARDIVAPVVPGVPHPPEVSHV